ncbi:hypothetical protein A2U01_0030018 [Trifolium medium]|uniref:Uncharacterized protein n=1 Tax=Trifolium medium TaxID=97028 RepID=A0A392PCB0_9FABA|nr:hypothetical protein [Trifolium medium]
MLSFEEFIGQVNQVMGVPHDYNGWGYFDSENIFHWVDDDESYETMVNYVLLNDLVNGGGILLMADEEQQHEYHLVLTHLLNKITEDECRNRIVRAINFALSASRAKRELGLQMDAIGGRRYIIRRRA